MKKTILIFAAVLGLLSPDLFAIHRGGDDLPYAQSVDHELDQPVNKKYNGKAFFMNLGPTGIRARIDPDAPTHFKVMYVFQDKKSPARGKVHIGDVIVGANGKRFRTPHGFHRKRPGSRGWQGPPFELAQAIEDSQGKDGLLTLIVYPGGRGRAKKTVEIQLKPVGRFSETYPWNCQRSENLLKNLCDFMMDNGFKGRHHYQIQQLLAVWAAGDRRVLSLVKDKAEALMDRPVSYKSTGMCTWGWGYSGIFLGEYYHAFKDRKVLPAVEALVEAYEKGQDWRSGGFSHRPFPAIQQRIANGGPKGYGAMAGPGGLSMLAQSIFKANGLPYSQRAYNRTHLAYLQTVGNKPNASIAYGFSGWPHTLIRIQDRNTPCKSEEGIGYRCPTGLEDVETFLVEEWSQDGSDKWNKKLVPSGSHPWIKKEADKLEVFASAHYIKDKTRQRMVVRPVEVKEPTRPYDTTPGGGGHVAPMGMGAAAHFIGNEGNKSWNYLGAHLASGCALSPKMLFDGHADATMHAFFSVVGAARAEEDQLRSYLDYVKTLIILSETHDGQGLVEQPFGCQRNSTCSIPRNRTAYTHVAILLLSLPKKNLMITGSKPEGGRASYTTLSPGRSSTSQSASRRSSSSSSGPTIKKKSMPPRLARRLQPGKRSKLDKALIQTLAALHKQEATASKKLKLGRYTDELTIVDVDPQDNSFTVSADGREWSIRLFDLSSMDCALVAVYVAALSPDSSDLQAMAGVFLETANRVPEAEQYFEDAGKASRSKFEKLFWN